MKVYILKAETQIPHSEYRGNLGVFSTYEKAHIRATEEYNKAMVSISLGEDYIKEDDIEYNEAFDDCVLAIYSKEGYFYCWEIEELELE